MCFFMCHFSKLEHIVHYKAKNQNTVKTNFRERQPVERSKVRRDVVSFGELS